MTGGIGGSDARPLIPSCCLPRPQPVRGPPGRAFVSARSRPESTRSTPEWIRVGKESRNCHVLDTGRVTCSQHREATPLDPRCARSRRAHPPGPDETGVSRLLPTFPTPRISLRGVRPFLRVRGRCPVLRSFSGHSRLAALVWATVAWGVAPQPTPCPRTAGGQRHFQGRGRLTSTVSAPLDTRCMAACGGGPPDASVGASVASWCCPGPR
jgi:hypothetical protein